MAGLAFRRRFRGSAVAFYLAIASLIMPGLFVGLGIALTFRLLGLPTELVRSGLGAQLTWTLPFGLLIMFAVLGRFNRVLRGGGDRPRRHAAGRRCARSSCRSCCPGIIGVALFGFTLSYDEFPRTSLTVGAARTRCRSRSGR